MVHSALANTKLYSAAQSAFAGAKRFFKQHKAARIALYIAAALLVLSIVFHPHGTKTFLVLGMDNYGSLDETGRSDVTMLVQVDFTRSKITAVTFARDMNIRTEKNAKKKINTFVRSYDEDTLAAAIEQNFGVDIDGWFRLNFTSVIELVDAIGGVTVELTEEEVHYLNDHAGIYPENPLSEGKSRLNGAQALSYARCRKLDNDLGRGDRQSKLVAAMVKQTRFMPAAGIVSVFNSLKHAWRSSLSTGEQVSLVASALWLRGAKVERIGLPYDGTWRYGDACIEADLEENRAMLLADLGLKDPDAQAGKEKDDTP